MPDQLTHEFFAKRVREKCRLHHASGVMELELVECRRLPAAPASPRSEPFALLFRGPKAPVLPQKIYRFEFAPLEAAEIFVVPIGPDEHGMRYEAIFN